jgi:hypothetical protein
MSQFRCSQAEEFSGPFVPFWLSIDWMRPMYTVEGHLLYWVYQWNVNLIQKLGRDTSRIMPDWITVYLISQSNDTEN